MRVIMDEIHSLLEKISPKYLQPLSLKKFSIEILEIEQIIGIFLY